MEYLKILVRSAHICPILGHFMVIWWPGQGQFWHEWGGNNSVSDICAGVDWVRWSKFAPFGGSIGWKMGLGTQRPEYVRAFGGSACCREDCIRGRTAYVVD